MSIDNDELDKAEIKELKSELKKYQSEFKQYRRIQAVLMVKLGETRKNVAEYVGVHRNTVGIWVKNYDENGLDGLKADYSNCGAKSRLTDEQLAELREILVDPNEHKDTRDARNLIKDKFDVEYSRKQVWVITREKLGLGYSKPYLVYDEAPEDAEEILKKNSKI